MSSISNTGLGNMAPAPDGGGTVEGIGRDRARTHGTRSRTRLRFLPVTGLLIATILALTGCCAGYCSRSAPPIGAGLQHSAQQHVAGQH